jgi:hypothetical protein
MNQCIHRLFFFPTTFIATSKNRMNNKQLPQRTKIAQIKITGLFDPSTMSGKEQIIGKKTLRV